MPSTFHTLERERLFRNPPDKHYGVPALQGVVAPHIESFNSLFEDHDRDVPGLLELSIRDIGNKVVFDSRGEDGTAQGNRMKIWLEDLQVAKPSYSTKKSVINKVFPSECRERLTSYTGAMRVKLCWSVNGNPPSHEYKDLGQLPIMIKSSRCNIQNFSSKELVAHKEESEEMGGYFIVNGIEKLVRLLIVPRRNHITALIRPSLANRGPSYTHYAVTMRCVREDQTSQSITLHYLNDGNCMLRFHWRKAEYLIPVMLIFKSLLDVNDKEILDAILQGDFENTFYTDRVEMLLRSFKSFSLYTREQCLSYLGEKFRVVMGFPEDWSHRQVGEGLLKQVVLVHLREPADKFRLLVLMIRKLYALVSGECCADNPDSPQHQEILLGGHLIANIIKEKLDDYLNTIRGVIMGDVRRGTQGVDFFDNKYMSKVIQKVPSDIGQKLRYFLATGNLVSNTGLDLLQTTGFTIVAEKLNFYRYLSHFRCVHRGAFFAELKTTSVRKLLPDSWGFLCPVHTPDGAPCGLLNHLSHTCKIITKPLNVSKIPALLATLGVSQPVTKSMSMSRPGYVPVMLDGRVVGWCTPKQVEQVARTLRLWKVEGHPNIPLDLEIAHVPPSHGGEYPGLYMFSGMARMMRPVKYLANNRTDMVGSFEQVYMNIACLDEDVVPGVTSHQEFAPTDMLSVIANLTPFSDFNQSPRNMYQCQMGKQSMGTPSTSIMYRTDNKLYRLQTGQTPVVRPALHDHYGMDGFPNGTNAIVAVISYTGYDMEDAMILNKSSHERGFGYGTVYKSEIVDLGELRARNEPITNHFGLGPDAPRTWREKLDRDGLPYVGVRLREGDPICAYTNDITGKTSIKKYKGMEEGIVSEVRLIGSDRGDTELQKVHIMLRITRSPIIGDKFSSRHGQKGVCSQKFPAVDMPFTESGMQPDVIINPHAFPSRMTIGMFVESIAGKSGALHGMAQDATPFKFSEKYSAADFFGEQLLKAGYNYYGNEPMYSGVTGEELRADIYIGVVYYQRLRHMVSDKYQVRTTGPVHNLTMQPIKGRKRAGGIRFGEMERDSLLAHGTSFLLQDRLMNCSDYTQSYVCRKCGSLLSPVTAQAQTNAPGDRNPPRREIECRVCRTGQYIDLVAIPYVFRYLATELMSMGIKMKLEVDP
ncbi:uncharacterized protein VTP21DRAFT_8714 [Calcarisporiella thermophila]|uniref:uncharacterized protein n=1 Tax=Calcarisporiella thermophila TaxID=911321 RepID=UPI00374407F0